LRLQGKGEELMLHFFLSGKRIVVNSVLILGILLGCFTAKCEGEITAKEYAIYSRLIEHFDLGAGSVIITSGTAVDEDRELLREDVLRQLKREFPSASTDAILNFKSKNIRSWMLERKERFPASYVLVTQKELDRLWDNCDAGRRCGWDLFYDKYPGSSGIITFSRVGFSSKGDEAVAYLGNRRGWKSGTGYFVFLRKQGDQWQVIKSVVVWMT